VVRIARLIPAWLKFKSCIALSLQQMFQRLRVNILDQRELEGISKPSDDSGNKIGDNYRLLNYVT